MTYPDRHVAGAVLATRLGAYAGRADAVVLGLVRGGVPVAAELARHLRVPLDVLVVRKLGVPWSPEVAFGALGPGDVQVLNDDVAAQLEPDEIAAVVRRESAELRRREKLFRLRRPALDLAGKTALIVDDGVATGATARAAVAVARKLDAARVVVVAPVGSADAVAQLNTLADEVMCLVAPDDFGSVSRFYRDFRQISDDEVVRLLGH